MIRHRASWLPALLTPGAVVLSFAPAQPAGAVPAFARKHQLRCTSCHLLPPRLNTFGEAFLARGYRLVEASEERPTVPLSAWITGRSEDHRDGPKKLFANRVELIGSGPLGKSASYFVEWRALSLEVGDTGALRDRSGRFEDVLLNLDLGRRGSANVGQFRALRQVDVSRRLSISEPTALSTSLPGDPERDPRTTSLRGFSPAGRSPGVALQYRSIQGDLPSDGLFHAVTIPFGGEFSAPLTSEARREAGFEFEDRIKGVFLETFYRRGLNSAGVHALIDDDRRLVQGLATLQRGNLIGTLILGWDEQDGLPSRMRYSAEGEYLFARRDRLRAAVGFRVEQISRAGREPAFIPYLAVSGPNEMRGTALISLQYRIQKNANAFFLELGGAL